MSARNRRSGHNFERQICREINDLGFKAVTSRQESKAADARGIDIIGSFPLPIQCKCSCNTPNIEEILNTGARCIFWKKTRKVGNWFLPVDEYVTFRKEDFYKTFL